MSEEISGKQFIKEWLEEASGEVNQCPRCAVVKQNLEDKIQHAVEWEESCKYFEKRCEELKAELTALTQENEKLRKAIRGLLDQVDYEYKEGPLNQARDEALDALENSGGR